MLEIFYYLRRKVSSNIFKKGKRINLPALGNSSNLIYIATKFYHTGNKQLFIPYSSTLTVAQMFGFFQQV